MAHFDEHCRDCERLLGDRHEKVNRWIDELFAKHGPEHRRYRHHGGGVREAQKKFGGDAAKAAIVHIVRDCGRVPLAMEYDKRTLFEFGENIVVAPEHLRYDGLDETARQKFDKIVKAEFERFGLPA